MAALVANLFLSNVEFNIVDTLRGRADEREELMMNRLTTTRLCIWCALALSSMFAATVRGAEPIPPAKFDAKLYEQTVSKAIQYLQTKGQAEDGSYSKQAGPAVTALITTAVLRTGRSVDDPLVADVVGQEGRVEVPVVVGDVGVAR